MASGYMSRAKTTQFGTRSAYNKQFEKEQKEVAEIQESMKQMDDFDKKYGDHKGRPGYPRIALKSDLKKF
jgi:hypothetical protein